jgi:hypothetical protein
MGGGTHGSIKCYQSVVSKYELEKVLKKVIQEHLYSFFLKRMKPI